MKVERILYFEVMILLLKCCSWPEAKQCSMTLQRRFYNLPCSSMLLIIFSDSGRLLMKETFAH